MLKTRLTQWERHLKWWLICCCAFGCGIIGHFEMCFFLSLSVEGKISWLVRHLHSFGKNKTVMPRTILLHWQLQNKDSSLKGTLLMSNIFSQGSEIFSHTHHLNRFTRTLQPYEPVRKLEVSRNVLAFRKKLWMFLWSTMGHHQTINL